MALPTPAEVQALPLSAALKATFAAVATVDIQAKIDTAASWFGSPEVKRHTQRDKAVKYAAAHLLWLQLKDEGVLPGGGGGGGGVLSSISLEGVGSRSWAVQAPTPAQQSDYLVRFSPFLTELNGILSTFPPGLSTAQWPDDGPPFPAE